MCFNSRRPYFSALKWMPSMGLQMNTPIALHLSSAQFGIASHRHRADPASIANHRIAWPSPTGIAFHRIVGASIGIPSHRVASSWPAAQHPSHRIGAIVDLIASHRISPDSLGWGNGSELTPPSPELPPPPKTNASPLKYVDMELPAASIALASPLPC